MKKAELVMLSLLLLGISIFCIGIALYVFRLMAKYSDWEIQLAFAGFIITILALTFSKILSKVELNG